MKKKTQSGVVIYQAKNGAIELRGDFTHDTVWATQADIASIFTVERSVITKHIRNIIKDEKLEGQSVCAKFAHTAEDGKTYQVQYYNLDAIISVGYRVNSKRETPGGPSSGKIASAFTQRNPLDGLSGIYTIRPNENQGNSQEI